MRAKITNRLVAGLKPADKPFEVRDTALSGFVLRVQPTGGMTYYFIFKIRGIKNRVKLGTSTEITPRQARDLAEQERAIVAAGRNPRDARHVAKTHTLGDFIEAEYGPTWLARRDTGDAALARLKSAFGDFWGKRLDQITPGAFERWRAGKLADGLSASTVNRYLDDLKACLAKAVEWGVLDVHPLGKVKRLKTDRSPNVRYLDPPEEKRLVGALDAREERLRQERDSGNEWRRVRGYEELPDLRDVAFADHLKPMVLVSLNTGLRRGELFSLRWADADIDRNMITIRAATAKSGQTRHVPMNSIVADTLRAWRDQTDGRGLVFKAKDGGRFDNVNTSWAHVLRDADIQDFRWHDMRHHFASMLAMAEVPLNVIRELLGHADLAMVLRYAHLAPEATANAVERLAKRTLDGSNVVPISTAKGGRATR